MRLAGWVLLGAGLWFLWPMGYCPERAAGGDGYVNEAERSGAVPTQEVNEPNIGDGLLAYWAMEDGFGAVVSDRSGNGNDGVLSSPTLPRWQPAGGHLNGALLFDGREGHVVCGGNPDFDLAEGLTVAAWIKVNAFTKDWQAIVTKGDSAWRLHRYSNTPYLDFACTGLMGGDKPWGSTVWGSTPVTDGEWHHAAGVFDLGDETEQVRLYVDGIEDGPQAVRNGYGYISTNTYSVLIGANAERPGRGWNGLIDDVRLYPGALTAWEIQYLVNYNLPPEMQPVAHWRLDESGGAVAMDSSGNSHHASLNAGPSPTWIQGKVGLALAFHGSGDYVNCGNDPIFDVTDKMTVAAWVYIGTVPADWTGIVTKGDDAWRLSTYSRTTQIHFAVTGPPDYRSINGNTVLTTGAWHYVVGTYDGADIRLYIDGVEDSASPAAYGGTIATSGHNVWIGGNSDRPGREFDGAIDEVAIWNRALSVGEIEWLTNDGMGNPVVSHQGIYVDDDAKGDPGPGNPVISDPNENGSWEHPFDSIQDAIYWAATGAVITVLDGNYTGPGNRGISFEGKAITLRSQNGPENCIIDCEYVARGFRFSWGEGPDSVLEGFTISNGNAYADEGLYGGGIYCDMGSPTIKGCIVKKSQAEMGGGIYLDFSSAILENCAIVENRAFQDGGGLMCWKSSPTLINCTIGNNSPDGLHVAYGSALISGVVKVISDSIRGDGQVRIDPDATLHTEDVHASVYVGGIGRIFVPAGKKLVVEGVGIVDLTDYDSPGARGTVQCNGLLVATDNASVTRTAVNATRAIFAGSSIISDNVFTTNRLIPYGQIALEDTATFINNDVYSQGDRYVDIEPAVFAGTILNNRIFVTQAGKRGGLFELRGEDVFCSTSCEPGLIPVESVPDFEPTTWTLERLELAAGARMTLTNREDYQAPYDLEGKEEVLYVKQLVLGPNSVLDTSFNRLYYEDLTVHPTAKVINRPLLGFSLDRIIFDDANEFFNRVGNNNLLISAVPNRSRIHVERVLDSQLDPSGLMVMRNLLDIDPESPTYGQMMHARAKGLFARSTEEEILIRFRYLFEGTEPGVKLAVYLSDVPELLAEDDPMRPAHYLYVGLLTEPPAGRPGSPGSERFGIFQKKVPAEHLDLTDGTYVELELIEPAEPLMGPLSLTGGVSLEGDGGGGGMVTIDDWGPEVHCDGICLDITWDDLVDEVDFLTVVGACGVAAELDPNETGSGACLEGAFSDDGYVDALDIGGWDWTLCSEERMGLCDGIPLGDESGGGGLLAEAVPMDESGGAMPLVSLPGSLDDLLIIGKMSSSSPSTKMKDRVYTFDGDGDYSASFAPSSERSNIRIVQGADGQLYQVNSEDGVVRLDASDTEIIEPGECSYADDPRYHVSATVYVGIQGEGEDAVGRPILDAAFDGDYVYVVPVVVNPVGEESYAAAAKLQLLGSGSPPYSVVKLYDDPPPPADNQYRNTLREIEIDDAGNVYVINANSLNESDLLWRYEPNGAYERVELGQPDSENYVPDPVAMYVSSTTDMLYLASAQYNPEDFNDSVIRGFSTDGALSLTRQITIHSMHHATGITEDPVTGMLYVIGFNMDEIPEYPDPTEAPFYEPRLAKVAYGSSSVDAQSLSGSHDLAMPLSISWTRAIKCGRADADGSGEVSFGDLAILGENWLNSSCTPPSWCSAADIDLSGAVGMSDVAILADNWLETGCAD